MPNPSIERTSNGLRPSDAAHVKRCAPPARQIVTPILKDLLHSYGLLYVTVVTLQKERPADSYASVHDYYAGGIGVKDFSKKSSKKSTADWRGTP
jgi:hypothetical protein